jgi:(S)-mandelate dehydrogenase
MLSLTLRLAIPRGIKEGCVYVGYNTYEFRARARQIVPRGLFEFVDRGAEDELCLRNNRDQIEAITLIPRVLQDTAGRTTATTLFGKSIAMPLAIAPTGAAGLLWHNGELALAKAAAAAGVPFTVSTASLTSMERIANEAGGTLWFQLYVWPDKEKTHALIKRVADAGYDTLVVTVDNPVPSNREYNNRSGFTIPFRFTRRNIGDVLMHPRWLASVIGKYLMTTGLPRYENYPTEVKQRFTGLPMGRSMARADSLSWKDFEIFRRLWPKTLMVKGLVHPSDAEQAIAHGADGVIVSNHGGRALDTAVAPIQILPAVVERVAGRVPVLMDGSIMRGSDIIKAVSLGASAVLVGRATLYGVAVGGQEGAARVLHLFREEIDRVMGQIGAASIADLGREYLALPGDELSSASLAAMTVRKEQRRSA